MIPLAACTYDHPWVIYLVAALIVAGAVACLRNGGRVSAFLVENFMGPWRTDPGARARWGESIDAWSRIVRLLGSVFAVFALLIAVLVSVNAATCG